MLESDHENRFVAYCKARGFECLKLRIDGADGFPDRTVITPAGVLFIEFKRDERSKLRPQQRVWLDRLKAQGQNVTVATSSEHARGILDRFVAALGKDYRD